MYKMESYQAYPLYPQTMIQQFLKRVSRFTVVNIILNKTCFFLASTFNKVNVIDYCKSYMIMHAVLGFTYRQHYNLKMKFKKTKAIPSLFKHLAMVL
jgi:hypothetical protein